jgi:hypothetical protein
VVVLKAGGIHYFNMGKIAFTRAGWILSIPNTLGILFLIWANTYFQQNYAAIFMNNFWVFLICIVIPFLGYMVFEYKRVWSAEIEISNKKSWDVGYNPFRELLQETNKEVKELKKLVKELKAAQSGDGDTGKA